MRTLLRSTIGLGLKASKHRHYFRRIAIAVTLLSVGTFAQEDAGQALPRMVRGNERFGRALLQEEHAAHPTNNIAVAPLPLSVAMAALQSSSNWEVSKEIAKPFGWSSYSLAVPTRMLMARFEPPVAQPCPP